MKYDKILIIDFGSQYTRLIAKAIRELGVYSEIISFDATIKQANSNNTKGIILSGGPSSVYTKGAPALDRSVYGLGIPILGICYGMHLIAKDFSGEVSHSPTKEYGRATLKIDQKNRLFKGLPKKEKVWMSHGDKITNLPPDFELLASSSDVKYAAIKKTDGEIYGIQFHPEVFHTPKGKKILKNFAFHICNASPNWTPANLGREKISELKRKLEDRNCIIAVSGGVDSSTAATLVHQAIRERLFAIYIDTGLMRNGETKRVQSVFESLGINLRTVLAQDRFIQRLEGIIDPEAKRKAVGEEFIRVFEEEAKKIEISLSKKLDVLVQGTIYSDVIESAGARGSDKIKSHHNVGGLPEHMDLEIVEPLRNLFKDEVRELAESLNLPKEIIWEQPFPGPGLSVRILGEVTKEKVRILQEADSILREEVKKRGLKDEIWQYFAVLLSLKSVAVVGDRRGYGNIIAIRAVQSRDGMTANWYRAPHDFLERLSTRITNQVKGITRVVYDITSKPPGTIEWE